MRATANTQLRGDGPWRSSGSAVQHWDPFVSSGTRSEKVFPPEPAGGLGVTSAGAAGEAR